MTELRSRRWLYLSLVLLTTGLAVQQLWLVMRVDGLAPLELLILLLFAILFAWIAASFWVACFGLVAQMDGAPLPLLAPPSQPSASRTAIIMPVYNEDVAQAFARVRAICEDVIADGATGFDFYVLSDSTNSAAWIAEELAWHGLRGALPNANIFYRHRTRNVGRKSGNIQDFCENWGPLYDYMVILDADSLMSGATLKSLVGMMDANPRTALIQTQVMLAGRNSLFARMLQFSSSVYGPVYAAGLAGLQGPDGNYWGHNAIIRVRAFIAHCGLPRLPGSPPFGGEIMSHDFIEAAFLRRAGWQVWMAPDLQGSYEEPPPTAHDFLKRDRRWCQGNLQHLKVIFGQGLRMPSRLHLAMGIMSYAASPLWLLLLIVSATAMLGQRPGALVSYIGAQPALSLSVSHTAQLVALVVATLVLLYAPKVMGVISLARRRAAAAHGGWGSVIAGLAAESIFSTLFAPIVMLQQSWFVLVIVMGIATGWGVQQRQDRALPWGFVIRHFAPHTMIGLAASWLLWSAMPQAFGWFVPLLLGMVLAIPLVRFTSSLELGRWLGRRGLFVTPGEIAPPLLLKRAHELAAAYVSGADPRLLVLQDPQVRALHLALLAESSPPRHPDRQVLVRLVEDARARRTEGFTAGDWTRLLSDAESLKALAAS